MAVNKTRAVWGSKLGFLLAAIGSAVGLGNIWRFSYMTYENGGGAFLVPYAIALCLAGLPLLVLEFIVGHKQRGASPLALASISKKWEWVGWWMPTVAAIGIQLFYSVVIAWCLNYFIFSFSLSWGSDAGAFFFNDFLNISTGPTELGSLNWTIVLATFVVWAMIWLICFKEVNHGIEKASTIFMPLLFILTAILVGWSLTLDGAMVGISHYLTPDWDKINVFSGRPETWKPWLDAFGQIFFTLSLGFGIMIAYASYLPQKTNLVSSGLWTALANCSYSIFAGFAVFGTLGFMAVQKGVPIEEVAKAGPGLAFVVYPEAISHLPFGNQLFGAAFFLTLVIAGLSSAVSLLEAFVCSLTDKFNWRRGTVTSVLCLLGFLASLIFTTQAGLYILDIVDHFVTNYALVIGGLLECIFVGWVLKAHVARAHVNGIGMGRLVKAWEWLIKYITPMILITIVTRALVADWHQPYEGYAASALALYGVGMLLVTVVIALVFSVLQWRTGTLAHQTQDEKLWT